MKGFTIVLGIAVVYVLVHQIALLFPAKEEWQHNLGMLFQGLSLSYIAAFIFFYVHNHFPLKRTKKKFRRIINKELSDLWEICFHFTGTLKKYSRAEQLNVKEGNYHETLPLLLKNLPVNVQDVAEDEPVKSGFYKLPLDPWFDELNPPIDVLTEGFHKWSDAISYIDRKANGTLNRILYVQNVVEEETLVDLFDLVKSLEAFLTIAKLYEDKGLKYFDNEYLSKNVINFYQVTNKLRPYNKAYKDPKYNRD
ncbi:hypothetical protein ACQKDD_15525 [Planococcus kocurii]|uniref:hypothetical protein n=1 Tax=Planococcus kocurii TaxID=1374 RepID=UPI003CFBF45C